MIYSFVILHFLNEIDTLELLTSISKLKVSNSDTLNIVIVDNFSNNGSVDDLKKIKIESLAIHLIESKKNLGFSRGNNLGIVYSKFNLKSDFIIVINNDTLIKQIDFLYTVQDFFNLTNAAVIGPDIISLRDKYHQNPLPIYYNSAFKLFLFIFKNMVLLSFTYFGLEPIFIKFRLKNQNEIYQDLPHKLEPISNTVLHGSCLILTPVYLKYFDGFYNKTFLYMEELILFEILQIFNLKSLYCPKLVVYHKEDGSTNLKYKKPLSKRRARYYHTIVSSIKYIELLIRRKNKGFIIKSTKGN
jgi:GT2 family glycosyltransferase